MAMDLDSSFGEFADDRRFIALVVSDNEDDYDSSTDEVASDNEYLEATPKANITPLGPIVAISTSSTKIPTTAITTIMLTTARLQRRIRQK